MSHGEPCCSYGFLRCILIISACALLWQISVDAGMVLPVAASHNTVCMSFAVEAAEYLRLHKPSPAVPVNHFSMLADSRRNKVAFQTCSLTYDIYPLLPSSCSIRQIQIVKLSLWQSDMTTGLCFLCPVSSRHMTMRFVGPYNVPKRLEVSLVIDALPSYSCGNSSPCCRSAHSSATFRH